MDIELLALVGRLATTVFAVYGTHSLEFYFAFGNSTLLIFIRCCKNGPLRSEHLSLFLSDGARV